MARETLINTPEDMEWLADVHIKDLKINWVPRSAVIVGNEDAPDEIRLYPRRDPLYTDTPLIGHPHGDIGKFVFCGPLTHTEAMAIDREEGIREGTLVKPSVLVFQEFVLVPPTPGDHISHHIIGNPRPKEDEND